MWPLEGKQDFSKIWPSDLLFDPTEPMIELDRDITKTNILKLLTNDEQRRRTTDVQVLQKLTLSFAQVS